MTLNEAMQNVGKKIHVIQPQHYIDTDYMLLKIRKYKQRNCYSVVCKDLQADDTIMVFPIECGEVIISDESEDKKHENQR